MKLSVLRRFSLGLATVLCVGVGAAPAALAQEARSIVPGLEENQGLIRKCRQLNKGAEIFDNTGLGPEANRIGFLDAGRQVLLTGVVMEGRAQIFLGEGENLSRIQPVGWVNAAFLTNCGDSPPSAAQACFRANQNLRVRANPSTSADVLAGYNPGDTVYTSANPPNRQTPGDGRTWVQVAFSAQTGWVAETDTSGRPGNLTSIACP